MKAWTSFPVNNQSQRLRQFSRSDAIDVLKNLHASPDKQDAAEMRSKQLKLILTTLLMSLSCGCENPRFPPESELICPKENTNTKTNSGASSTSVVTNEDPND